MENTLSLSCEISTLLHFENAGEKYPMTITNEQCGIFILLEYFFISLKNYSIIINKDIVGLLPMLLVSFSFFFIIILASRFWYLFIISCVVYCILFLTFTLPVRQRGLALTVGSNNFGPLVNFHQLFRLMENTQLFPTLYIIIMTSLDSALLLE